MAMNLYAISRRDGRALQTHIVENGLVVCDDSLGYVGFHVAAPVIVLIRAPEQNFPLAREHVGDARSTADRQVVDGGVGLHKDELPFDRHQLFIVEECFGDEGDLRDFRRGFESNFRHKKLMLAELMGALAEEGWLTRQKKQQGPEDLVTQFLASPRFNKIQFMYVLEFGRTVHAEMAALTDAARRGVSTNDSMIYT